MVIVKIVSAQSVVYWVYAFHIMTFWLLFRRVCHTAAKNKTSPIDYSVQ